MPFPELHVIVVTGNNSMTHCDNDNTLALKEGSTRHSADILRRGGEPGRVSGIGGATFCHRQNFRTPLKLIQIALACSSIRRQPKRWLHTDEPLYLSRGSRDSELGSLRPRH
ncbi:hypothetical protein PUN28_007118 [Cardiocondyla obscurior]|uniref:Uncharacterized protein n=1 Tax=Cardiocondyla obscurior TaxID=286306 RepID=A0AAW2G378_9HYME